MLRISRLLSLYGLSLFIILLDQLSKIWARTYLNYAEPNELFSWLNFTLHYNQGAAFSILSQAGGWQRWLLSLIAIVVSMILIVWLYKLRFVSGMLPVALSLILGGAVGNVLDRLQLGHVVDFISIHYYQWYFPTFNVADSAISVGAVFLLIDSIIGKQ